MNLSNDPHLLGVSDRDATTDERKRKKMQAIGRLMSKSMALAAMLEPCHPYVGDGKPSRCKRGTTGKAWDKKKTRRKMAKKARRGNR